MMPRLFLAGLVSASESAIAAGMRAAQLTPEDLAPMVGKVLRLQVTDLDLDLWIVCGEKRWWLSTESQEHADVELSGTLGSLVEIARSITKPDSPLIFDGLDIRGSVGVLQTMQSMFRSLELDWEDVVTRALGPIPAGLLIRTLRTAREQWLISRASLQRQAEDFVRSEQTLAVTDSLFSGHANAVTQLDRNIDRLAARIKRLESRDE